MIPSLGYQLRALARALGVGLHSFIAQRKARHQCARDGHKLRLVADKHQAFEYCDVFGCLYWSRPNES